MTDTISAPGEAFVAEWEQWHRDLDAQRSAPHGFLAYTGFHLLDAEPRRFDGLPGAWSSGPDGPAVELDAGEQLQVADRPVAGRHGFGPLVERQFLLAASFGDARAELSRRGGRDIVRALHPDHGTRTAFRGTPTYAPDPAWAIPATFEPAEREIELAAYLPAITHRHDSPGRVRFEHAGAEHTLTLIRAGAPSADGADVAIALFRDATSGVTTYQAGRSLLLTLPVGTSDLTLDFNRARNLQCAYIEFAPCPLAPAENQLPFAVDAGERTPWEKLG